MTGSAGQAATEADNVFTVAEKEVLAMDFGALPPEVNSLRMYTGPGSAPMLAAMTAWDAVAAEMRLTATAYESVIAVLVGDGWLGQAASAMLGAVAPYLAWMSVTGVQAEQTAMQAAAAAAAFEAAFSMTVPPAVVAANRVRLLALVATNFLGINTPAIAATEAEYAEMWTQDATAMYVYAGSAAEAAALAPFVEPERTTAPSGPSGQAAAVTRATGSAASGLAQTQLPELMTAVPASLQELASPAAAAPFDALPQTGLVVDLLNFLDGADGNPYGTFLNSTLFNGIFSAGYTSPAVLTPGITDAIADVEAVAEGAAPDVAASAADAGAAGESAAQTAAAVTQGSAGFGHAELVGRLSVPPTWTVAVEVAGHGGIALAGTGPSAVTAIPAGAGTPGLPGMPAVNAGARSWGNGPRYGSRLTVMPRPVAAG